MSIINLNKTRAKPNTVLSALVDSGTMKREQQKREGQGTPCFTWTGVGEMIEKREKRVVRRHRWDKEALRQAGSIYEESLRRVLYLQVNLYVGSN